ncbi:hypothetical protein Tco_0601899 [Tanacetum coccineum]
MSSAEAEYVIDAGCCTQVLWNKSQLADYDVLYNKVPIFYDNTSVIAISNNLVLHSRTKHIDIRYHFIKDHILKGDIELHFVPIDLELANIFMKPLAEPNFTRLVAELGMLNIEKQSCISAALTKQPSAYYSKYLREFQYIAEADFTTNTISFTFSTFDKPLSFNLNDFSTIIGLKPSENCVSIPPKENVKAGLATMRLFNEDHPSILSSDLVNSSSLTMKYFSPIWRVLLQYIVNAWETYRDLTIMAELSPEPIQSLLPPFGKPAEELMATADTTQSLDASESVKKQGNQLKLADAEKVTV